MSNLKADSVIACLDCPEHVQAVLDAGVWAAKRLNAPLGLLHAAPNAHRKTAVDYSGCLNLDDESQMLNQFTLEEKTANGELKAQGQLLLQQAGSYCEQQPSLKPQSVYPLHRHASLADSIDYVDNDSQLIVIGHHVTCKATLAQLIRPSECPILVTHAPFSPPKTALFAFDNKETCHRMLKWLCQSSLVRSMTIHVVMIGKETTENCDALREAYAKLTQAGIKCKKSLIDCRDVPAALNYYQSKHELGMLMTGAFGQSRLRELFRGSDTEKLLTRTKTPYLLFPTD